MRKMITIPLTLLTLVGIVGCTNTESIRSDDLYSTISEQRMPEYCRRKIAIEFGFYAGDIFTFPVSYEQGSKLVYGKYKAGHKDLKEFICVFNSDDTYAGIKLQHSNVRSKLCLPSF